MRYFTLGGTQASNCPNGPPLTPRLMDTYRRDTLLLGVLWRTSPEGCEARRGRAQRLGTPLVHFLLSPTAPEKIKTPRQGPLGQLDVCVPQKKSDPHHP